MFSSWFISYLPPGRRGRGPLLWHLRAALVLLLAEQGSSWAGGTPSARLRFCYYLNPCRVGFCSATVPESFSRRVLGRRGGLGLDCVGGPRQEARPASRLQKFLCFLPIVTKVLLMPTAGLGATPTRNPFQGSSGVPCPGWEQRLVTSVPLFPGPGYQGSGGSGGSCRGRAWGPWSVVLAWPLPGVSPLPLWLSRAHHRLHRGSRLQPHVQSPQVYRLWYISPKSLALSFTFFS